MLKGHLPVPPGYRALFDAALPGLPGPRHADRRRSAFAAFESAGLPGARAEAWKYTPAARLLPDEMQLASEPSGAADVIAAYRVRDVAACLVFVDGVFDPDMSDTMSAGSVVSVTRLATALSAGEDDGLERALSAAPEHSLDQLNAALLQDGCIIRVGDGDGTGKPVQVIHLVSARPSRAATMANLCHVIDVGDRGSLHLLETTVFEEGAMGVLNLRSRCRLGAAANVVYERLQVGAAAGSALTRATFELAGDARLTHNLVTTGGQLVRNEIGARIDGSDVEARCNGLYAVGTGAHVDNLLQIRHAAPSSMSDQAYRGVLNGKARAAFAGQIVVERPAQKTNAYQSNNNLLLSPDAEINTKPELEIYADDVKCSHGATAGEIDERELFYLRTRGLDPDTARSMLTYAFAGEVLERLVDPTIARTASRELLTKLPGGSVLEGMLA